jgi:hypothetical protein
MGVRTALYLTTLSQLCIIAIEDVVELNDDSCVSSQGSVPANATSIFRVFYLRDSATRVKRVVRDVSSREMPVLTGIRHGPLPQSRVPALRIAQPPENPYNLWPITLPPISPAEGDR